MWIKTPTGELINADRIRAFNIGDNNKSVVAVASSRTHICIGEYGNTKEARDALEKISSALKLGKNFLALD